MPNTIDTYYLVSLIFEQIVFFTPNGWIRMFVLKSPLCPVAMSMNEMKRCSDDWTISCRFNGRLNQLEQLVDDVKQVRPGSEMLEVAGPQRRTQRKKTTIKQLFSAASKFQKNLKR